ncbi:MULTISPECIES: YdeI/OmpD-associated family protein [Sphingobacterium]|uniref:YdeI family protein n=1 Tax=Sphingobacterium populi TaxID=1812824 RepID=A0ABW5U9U4_9SPHI|nr:YdeI/OmpD-associated family protein [Sphingobacterium sp. CFCC 11742]
MDPGTGYTPSNRAEWREWLLENHLSTSSVWVVFYKKESEKHNLTWQESVDEALCFGWIDGRRKAIDEERYMQFFCKRKANSAWSKINKEKVRILINCKMMFQAGLDAVQLAKQNGSWNSLDDVEALVIPSDLEAAINSEKCMYTYYNSLSNSAKKIILLRLQKAKTSKTRAKRIAEIVRSLGINTLPPKLGS